MEEINHFSNKLNIILLDGMLARHFKLFALCWQRKYFDILTCLFLELFIYYA